jgi:hypothetical protein
MHAAASRRCSAIFIVNIGSNGIVPCRDAEESAQLTAGRARDWMTEQFDVVRIEPTLRETGEIESAVAAFARSSNGGLIMPGSAAGRLYRDLIIALAARHKLPAVYYERHFAAAGGLMTYGPDFTDPAVPLATSIASSRARSRPTFRCRRRPNTNW